MDGNTATISPVVSEEQMRSVAETFERMRDAIINSSKLAEEVAELRVSVEGLRQEVEKARSTNRWLDEQVTQLRQARDLVFAERNKAQADLIEMTADRDRLQRHADNQRAELERLNRELSESKRLRDDAELRVMELEEQNAQLKESWEKAQAIFCPPTLSQGTEAAPDPSTDWRDPVPSSTPY